MDIIKDQYEHTCSLHDQNSIIYISIETDPKTILKCSECVLQEGINIEKLLSIESIQKQTNNKVHRNWTFSKENDLVQPFNEYNKDITEFQKKKEEFCKLNKSLSSQIIDKLELLSEDILDQMNNQLELKSNYMSAFNKLSLIDDLVELLNNKGRINTNQLNQNVKQIIIKSQQQSQQSQNQLKSMIKNIENFNIGNKTQSLLSLKQDILNLLSIQFDLTSIVKGDPQVEQPQTEGKKELSKNTQEILKLISNKSNGCKDQFVSELTQSLASVQQQLDKLNMENIYKDTYPIRFDHLNSQQFQDIHTYSINPEEYRLMKVKDIQDLQQQVSSANSSIYFQHLFSFTQSTYQESSKLVVEKVGNAYIFNNTKMVHKGQILTHIPLQKDKEYLLRFSFNKSFIQNYLYFGLIKSHMINQYSISSQDLGFTYSSLKQQKPMLVSGQDLLLRQKENIQMEIRINIKKQTMLVFSYPDYHTILNCEINLSDQISNYHFGVDFQTETNFQVTIFHQQILN